LPSVIEKRSDPFSQEQLEEAWKAFRETRSLDGKIESIIYKKVLKLRDDSIIEIILSNKLEVSFLEKIETEMVQFLRNHLKNDHISLQKEVQELEDSKILYTSSDIYDEMVKQNPKLKELKERLGLDFDY